MCDMMHSCVIWCILVRLDSSRCNMTHSFAWHDPHTRDTTDSCAIWLIYLWHDSSICGMTQSYVTWLIYAWHDPFMCDMPHSRDVTHSYVTCLIHIWHDSFVCDLTPSWWHHVSVCDMNSFMSHDSSIYTSLLIFLSTTPACAHINTHSKKYWHRTTTQSILCCSNWHICMHPYIHFFLMQIWEAPCWKRPVRDLYTQRVRRCVLQCLVVCCSVVKYVASRDVILKTRYCPSKKTKHHQMSRVCHLTCALYAIKRALQPNYPYLPWNYDGR